eukprot:m.11747 g.11747  ORF g.11747 m.11747 type:complete len:69 (+) comp23578_c0_seq1:361-567(+)
MICMILFRQKDCVTSGLSKFDFRVGLIVFLGRLGYRAAEVYKGVGSFGGDVSVWKPIDDFAFGSLLLA